MKKNFLLLLLLSLLVTIHKTSAQEHFVLYTGGDNYIPYNFSADRAQWLYLPGDITGGATLQPGMITKFYIRAASTIGGTATLPQLTIKMGTTTTTSFTGGPWIPNMTTVFSAANYPQTGTANTWVSYDLQTPFFWDLTENLVVEISVGATNAGGFTIKQGGNIGNKRMYGLTGAANSQGTDYTQASIGFDMISEDDMGVIAVSKPEDLNDICAGLNKFSVTIKNFGGNGINSGNVSYSINNVFKGTASIQNAFASLTTTEVELPGFVQTAYNVPFVLKAWTHDPNNVVDPINMNDTFEITITPSKLGVVLNDMVDTFVCKGGSITLDAGTNINTDYTWSNGTQAQHNTISIPGQYWVWGYNTEGCQSFDTFNVSYAPMPEAANSISVIDLNNGVLLFDIGAVQNVNYYEWDFGDASPFEYGAGPKPHTYAQAGSYTVRLKMANDCDTINRAFNLIWSGKTSIHELNKNDKISVYPNPAKDHVKISAIDAQYKFSHIKVINALGQIMLTQQVNTDQIEINTASFASGNYYIKIDTDFGEVIKAISIVK